MPKHNSYTMDIYHERNCYSCESFGYITRNCRNSGNVGRRLKYKNNQNSNLNREENLIVLD